MYWLCAVCGYVHEGEGPPDICPMCAADKSAFSLMQGAVSYGAWCLLVR
ncbi:MAG TPA: hypothetical protein VGO93_02175 [Candidatus Xenobia bacterium]|jgi:rubrerythrin